MKRACMPVVMALIQLSSVSPGGTAPAMCAGLPATIVGTEGNDTITGTILDDVIVSLGGGDTIDGLSGNDVICSGDDNDQVKGGPGDDILIDTGFGGADGGLGNDIIIGYQAAIGGEGNDVIKAGAVRCDRWRFGSGFRPRHPKRCGFVEFIGDLGDDVLIGQRYNGPEGQPDELRGGPGNDVLRGRGGFDLLYPGPGNDRVYGGRGWRDFIRFDDIPEPVIVNLGERWAISGGLDKLHGVEFVRGSAFGDVLIGTQRKDLLSGCGGSDIIKGLEGDDVLLGGESDLLGLGACPGQRGADVLDGGPGYDICNVPNIRFECEYP